MKFILIISACILVLVAGLFGLAFGGWSSMSASAFVTFALLYALGIFLLLGGAGGGNDGD
ncbi:hypothetical protein [Cereibacter changlensis]|uniref:hypothetical protein n=1 Tax=Cereibacter changlensis TaxID=402884 RepID=UPI0040343696